MIKKKKQKKKKNKAKTKLYSEADESKQESDEDEASNEDELDQAITLLLQKEDRGKSAAARKETSEKKAENGQAVLKKAEQPPAKG